MTDAIRRFIIEGLDIRGAVVHLGRAWQEMQATRDYNAPERDLLGELAAVAALIGSNLKQPGRITFQLQGNGHVRMLLVDCDEQLRIRGLAKKRDLFVPAAPVPELLGDGQLVLNLHTNASTHPYQSHVPLEGNTLAEIFEHYL